MQMKNSGEVFYVTGLDPGVTPLTFCLPEFSHMVTPSYKGCWEM